MIILFDVDGVLVQSLAYRAALQATVKYFCQRLGAGDWTLTDADVDVFESQSITVEWDSSAISVAALVMERLRAHTPDGLTGDLWAALDILAAHPVSIERPDFSALARRIGAATPVGRLPSHTALELFAPSTPLSAAPFLQQLLSNCYRIDHAPAMQVFQSYVLGHTQYEQYYGLPARVRGEPMLEKLDQPLLRPEMAEQLLRLRAEGKVFPVLYTARPSLAPREIVSPRGYTPEAEIARRMVGLDPIPVIAFGKVDWMAQRVGLSGGDLVKPSPAQAIAAMGAARSGLETEALKAAVAVVRGDHLRYPLTACAGETVHVFEDSASSLRAVTRAVELLNRQGLGLRLVRHGIAPKGSPKNETLGTIADVVHEDVNAGLEEVVSG